MGSNIQKIKRKKLVEDILYLDKKRSKNFLEPSFLSPYKTTKTVLHKGILLSHSICNKYAMLRNKPFVFFNTHIVSFKYGIMNNYSAFGKHIKIVSFDNMYINIL